MSNLNRHSLAQSMTASAQVLYHLFPIYTATTGAKIPFPVGDASVNCPPKKFVLIGEVHPYS
jgi:hypothetical protein